MALVNHIKSDRTAEAAIKHPSGWRLFGLRHWWHANPWPTRLWYILLVAFALQASVVVFVTKFGVPPDETNHIHFIDYYTEHSLSPILTDQQPTYNLGDKTREVDYLYHYVMSLVRRILPFSQTMEHYIIRLISVGVAAASFVVLRRVFLRVGVSEWANVAALAVASGLAMVLMVSGAINNDAFVWLALALGMSLIVRLYQKTRLVDLLWLGSLVAYGGLTKRTFLPIGVVLGVVGFILALRHWRHLMTELRRPTAGLVVALLVLFGGLVLGAERIGGNIIKYGHITPTCDEVRGEAACEVFWWNIRESYLAQREPERLVAPIEFVGRWFQESFINILDIQTQGWRHEVKPPVWLEPLLLAMIVIGVGYGAAYELRRCGRDKLARQRLLLLGIGVFYILFHLLVNYSEYQRSRVFGLALNGRYILAGLLPLLFLTVWYWSILLRRIPVVLLVSLALLFIGAITWGSGLHILLQNPQLFRG